MHFKICTYGNVIGFTHSQQPKLSIQLLGGAGRRIMGKRDAVCQGKAGVFKLHLLLLMKFPSSNYVQIWLNWVKINEWKNRGKKLPQKRNDELGKTLSYWGVFRWQLVLRVLWFLCQSVSSQCTRRPILKIKMPHLLLHSVGIQERRESLRAENRRKMGKLSHINDMLGKCVILTF